MAIVLVAAAAAVVSPGHRIDAAVLALVALAQVVELLRFVRRTNAELERFLAAARYSDFQQRFEAEGTGEGFDRLGETLDAVLERLRHERSGREQEIQQLEALVDQVPVALLTATEDGALELQNNAARRLFGSGAIARVDDLAPFGPELVDAVARVAPGERRLATFVADGMEQRMTLAATELTAAGRIERLISIQDIQNELAGAEIEAWQELVRVLTHEIMNSMTPVASLARTAEGMVVDLGESRADDLELAEELKDLRAAVATVARRADALTTFVDGYRRLTRMPAPRKRRVEVATLFQNAARLVRAEWADRPLELAIEVDPPALAVEADPDLVEQVLLNLLKNAADATGERDGKISMRGRFNRRGRVTLEVADDGPGVPDEVVDRIFVPFFTTKKNGTGVGLALTRQIMIAHGGSVTVGPSAAGGALFTMTF